MKIAERIARLKAELESVVEIEIMAPSWARTPIGAEQAPAAAEAPAAQPSSNVIDAAKARQPQTPRKRRRR